ncbi:MAG: class I SAM-dependent methyltransferase [Bacteroidales bacterium]|nr:class I SAM-dependent methyltransferase [Bacteroidales bacterium]
MQPTWDQRYSEEEFIYGKEPNDFLRENFMKIPEGKVLFLAEGEGRNAVFLAKQPGYEVTAMDSSSVGMKKAKELAEEQGAALHTIVADLNDFDLGEEQWDGIVSIFCHLPFDLRKDVHKRIIRALKNGGVLLSESYVQKQLDYKTGGPKTTDLLVKDLPTLKSELMGLQFEHLVETVREVHEGRLHFGKGAVVQVIAKKQ